jgi:hypothetical protein
MSGTREGGLKVKASILARSGMTEAEYQQYVVERGRKGGSAKVPKGFAVSGMASKAGRMGGRPPKR